MKKILFLVTIFTFFISIQTTFGLAADQVGQIDTGSKILGLISPDTIINIVTKLFLVIITIIGIIIFKKISSDRLISYLETKFDGQGGGGEEVIGVITRSFSITTLIIGFSLILGILGVDLGIFMGGIGFGIGFTLKTFLTNFTAGIVMVTQGVYHNGDLIGISGDMGKIVKINSLFTAVEKLDGVIFYIPNINFLENKVSNYNSNDKRRLEVEVLVDYDTDLVKAKMVLSKVLDSFPNILNDPKPKVIIDKLDDSGILIVTRAWISSADKYITIKSNITETINLAFKQSKIKISYPHLEIIKKIINN